MRKRKELGLITGTIKLYEEAFKALLDPINDDYTPPEWLSDNRRKTFKQHTE